MPASKSGAKSQSASDATSPDPSESTAPSNSAHNKKQALNNEINGSLKALDANSSGKHLQAKHHKTHSPTNESSVSPYTLVKTRTSQEHATLVAGSKPSPYDVGDSSSLKNENNNESNQKYSPPFLSELKLEEYQNIKNETHHNQQHLHHHHHHLHHMYHQAAEKSIVNNNNNNGAVAAAKTLGKKRPLNPTEANITPEYICALIKPAQHKLEAVGGAEPPATSSVTTASKKRFKPIAETAVVTTRYSPTPTALTQRNNSNNNENVEMIASAFAGGGATRPSSTSSNSSSSMSSTSPKGTVGAAPLATNSLKKSSKPRPAGKLSETRHG